VKILGVDPGLQVCGYAVIKAADSSEQLIEAGVIRSSSLEPVEHRLNQIAKDMAGLLKKFEPDIVAVEKLYSHYAHPRTAILMGHARGVILQTAAKADVPVRSFSATRIKKAVTGNGRASKTQVQKAIKSLLNLKNMPQPSDVADAIAAALCCANEL